MNKKMRKLEHQKFNLNVIEGEREKKKEREREKERKRERMRKKERK